jgi:hypothetical protein
MRNFARIVWDLGDEKKSLSDALQSVFADSSPTGGFLCFAPLDDDRTQRVLRLLEDAGLTPWDFARGLPWNPRSEYWLRLEREYDGEDLGACEFLEICPPSKGYHLAASERTDDGRMIIPQRQMPIGYDIMSDGLYRSYFIAEKAKTILEGNRLSGAEFKPASYRRTERKDDPDRSMKALSSTPYWELDSDFTMPPLSSTVGLTDRNGKPVRRDDFSNGLQRSEGLFTHPELHYRQSDIEKLEPFDLARTFEPFGNRSGYERLFCPLIASKRFYETCVANKLKTGWVPVRIDPD